MLLKLVAFNNVVANQPATLDLLSLTAGKVIDRIVLLLGGTFTKAQLTDIRIKANGKIIWNDNGDRTDKRMQYRGIAATANKLTIDFSEIRAKDQLEQQLGSLDTLRLGGGTLTMEVDIGAATNPTLAAWAECSWQTTQVENAQAGAYSGADLIGKVLNFPHQVAATAAKYPITIPYGKQGGSLIKRIHLVPPASGITINGFEVRKNGVTIFDSTKDINDFINTEYQRVTQTGWFHFDTIKDGCFFTNLLNAADAKTMEFYADVTVSTPGTMQVVVEMLDPLANN
jgi:hypothetical protein